MPWELAAAASPRPGRARAAVTAAALATPAPPSPATRRPVARRAPPPATPPTVPRGRAAAAVARREPACGRVRRRAARATAPAAVDGDERRPTRTTRTTSRRPGERAMTGVLARYFEENRRLLTWSPRCCSATSLFYLLLTAPAKLRARSLRSDLAPPARTPTRRSASTARRCSRPRLYESAESRIAGSRERRAAEPARALPTVDSKIKEIAAKFRLEATQLQLRLLRPAAGAARAATASPSTSRAATRTCAGSSPRSSRRRTTTAGTCSSRSSGSSSTDSTETGAELNLTIGVAHLLPQAGAGRGRQGQAPGGA